MCSTHQRGPAISCWSVRIARFRQGDTAWCVTLSSRVRIGCTSVTKSECRRASWTRSIGRESAVQSVQLLDAQHDHAAPSRLGHGDNQVEVAVALLQVSRRQRDDKAPRPLRRCGSAGWWVARHSSIRLLSPLLWVISQDDVSDVVCRYRRRLLAAWSNPLGQLRQNIIKTKWKVYMNNPIMNKWVT